MSSGGRPVLEIDLETGATFAAIKDTFAYAPGQQNQQASREPSRYGGSQVMGESNDNGTVTWQAFVRGATADVAAANIESLLGACNRTARDRLLEWRPDGATYSSYFRIAGPAQWVPTYSWAQWKDGPGMVVAVTFPVRPLALWDPMTIGDDFGVDSLADYTFDGATAADVAVSGGALTPVTGATLATERRSRHTVRGYPLLEGQATIKATPGSTIASFKAGVILRGSAPSTYVEVYVDDNGTSSRLRVDVVIAGTRTNRASVNLAARVSNGTALWVRGRVVGGVVFAEHFTSIPTPTGNPTTASPSGGAGYTLVAGDAPLNTTAGHMGWSWVPQQSAARLDDFEARPYVRVGVTPPIVASYADAIPGAAPALADVSVAQAATPGNFAMLAWAQQSGGGTVNVPGVLDSSAATHSGLTETASGSAYGGSFAITTSNSLGHSLGTAPGAVSLVWSLSSINWTPDDFADGTIDVEIWARFVGTLLILNPRARAALTTNGTIYTYAVEYGSEGRPIPNLRSSVFMRLGVIPIDAVFASGSLEIAIGCDSGSSTDLFGVDMALLVPARRCASSPSDVDGTNGYPKFLSAIANAQRTIRSDLSGLLSVPPAKPSVFHGLGGSLIQPGPGLVDLLVDVHPGPPADPVGTTGDPLSNPVTTMLDVVPRSYMLRGA